MSLFYFTIIIKIEICVLLHGIYLFIYFKILQQHYSVDKKGIQKGNCVVMWQIKL